MYVIYLNAQPQRQGGLRSVTLRETYGLVNSIILSHRPLRALQVSRATVNTNVKKSPHRCANARFHPLWRAIHIKGLHHARLCSFQMVTQPGSYPEYSQLCCGYATHAGRHIVFGEQRPIFATAVLAAAVRVMNQARCGLLAPGRLSITTA